MNELREFVAGMYFLCAKLARWSAVLIGIGGFAYGALALSMEREFAGLGANQLFMFGVLGPVVMFAISVICVMVGDFMSQDGREAQS